MKKLACLLLASAALTPVLAADWKMDATASRLDFIASFEKSPAPGIFKSFDVQLDFDPERPAEGRLEVLIQIGSADMTIADVNKAITGPEWFDVARHPEARFRATEIRRVQADQYLARGMLTLKGVQQPVDVPFSWSSAAADAASMQGEFTLQRAPFRIGTGEWAGNGVIGPDVTVKFRLRLRKAS